MHIFRKFALPIVALGVAFSLGAVAMWGVTNGGIAVHADAAGAPAAVPPVVHSAQAVAQAPPAGLWARPPIGSSWEEYFGVELEATLNASGPRVLNPKPGQLYFYTNSGTG